MRAAELLSLLRHNDVFCDQARGEIVDGRPSSSVRLTRQVDLRQLRLVSDLLCQREEDMRLSHYDLEGFNRLIFLGFYLDDLELPRTPDAFDDAKQRTPSIALRRKAARLSGGRQLDFLQGDL